MRKLTISVLLGAALALPALASEPAALEVPDLEIVVGADWTGSLTYLNYQEPFIEFTIPATLTVTATETGLKLAYAYPEEPHANSTVQAEISANGTKLMGEPIVSNTELETGGREIRTQFACEDMGQSATCEMTYSLAASELRITKMVTYDGETEAFHRNAYVFTR